MATGGWPYTLGYSDYPNHLYNNGGRNLFTEHTLPEQKTDIPSSVNSQKFPLLPKYPISLPSFNKTEPEMNPPEMEHDEDWDSNDNSTDKQLFPDGVPSWEEMELQRKAKTQGMKRVKILEHKCEVCDRIFSRKSFLKNHWVTHTHEKPFSCPQCDLRFTLASSVKRHLRTTHSSDKQFKCVECGKAYAQAYSLSCHMRTHSDDHPYKCPECGKRLTGPSHLKRHLEQHNKPKEYKCGDCDKPFTSPSELKQHVRDDHTDRKKYFCEECGKSFSKNSNLTYHLKTHSGERPHMCDMCGECFTLRSHLQRHIKRQHPETIQEEVCKIPHIDADEDMVLDPYGHFRSKPSANNDDGDDHVMYTCGDCGRCFIKEEHLREHTKTLKHTGELDYLEEENGNE